MELDISDRVALVTGAGRGNGAAIAAELAANGATVVVNDLDLEPAETTAASIREAGGRPSRTRRTSPRKTPWSRWSQTPPKNSAG